MQQPDLISVIIPVFNGEKYIADAIESVLAQQHRPLEIIVIDDGSTDDTASVVQQFQEFIKYYYQKNAGPAAARNLGLKHAQGQIIAFLDADDLWSNDKLAIQLTCLQENPTINVVLGRQKKMLLVNQKNKDDHKTFEAVTDDLMAMNLGTGLFKKRAFDKVGQFDETLRYSDDWDWFMRAKEIGIAIMTHKAVVLFYRRHQHNITNNMTLSNYYNLRMLKKSLDRRRAAGDGFVKELPNIFEFSQYEKQYKTEPLISIIMPVYNTEQYVCEAIDSVFQQNIKSFELIIIDDGSTDNTAMVIKKYIDEHDLSNCIQFYTMVNKGYGASLNRGLNFAKGSYIAFIDADDIWEEDKLSKQFEIMKQQPELDMVFGNTQQFHSPELSDAERAKIHCPPNKQPAICPVAMLIKASSFRRVGNFNEKWRTGNFIDWFAHAKELGLKYFVISDVVFKRRLHKNNMGIYMRNAYVDYLRILKDSVDRRRKKVRTT